MNRRVIQWFLAALLASGCAGGTSAEHHGDPADAGEAGDDAPAADASGLELADAAIATAACGDGFLHPDEECDDGDLEDDDGCDASCDLEASWICNAPGVSCVPAQVCGNGVLEDGEACDDRDDDAGDGCDADCALEAGWTCAVPGIHCSATECGDGVVAGFEACDDGTAGDGVRQAGEACDDGNLFDADGCSTACAIEDGFTCEDVVDAEPDTLQVTIVYRDFRGADLEGGHPDFEAVVATDHGIVADLLDVDGKPVYAGDPTTPTTHGAEAFDQWFRDVADVNLTLVDELALTRTDPGTYVFDDGDFFPLDGRGFVELGTEAPRTGDHNFGFTSELRYWFDYAGGEVLTFRGDDDVWVFINGRLAIDLGGVHGAQSDSITLDEDAAADLALTIGGTYEVVVFQAERHVTQSSYKLTLQGFNSAHSVCDDDCGDGVTSPFEVCDDGVNQGGWGSCTADCMGYGPRCGDGVVQASDEACDDGGGANVGGYDGCLPTCQLGPRCGDGVVQAGRETCDAGAALPTEGCDAECQIKVE